MYYFAQMREWGLFASLFSNPLIVQPHSPLRWPKGTSRTATLSSRETSAVTQMYVFCSVAVYVLHVERAAAFLFLSLGHLDRDALTGFDYVSIVPDPQGSSRHSLFFIRLFHSPIVPTILKRMGMGMGMGDGYPAYDYAEQQRRGRRHTDVCTMVLYVCCSCLQRCTYLCKWYSSAPVSYTHLTLPTTSRV